MTRTIQIAIEGMHCGGCVRRVTAAIEKLAGTGKARVEIGSAVITVEGESPTAEELIDAITKLGFTASER